MLSGGNGGGDRFVAGLNSGVKCVAHPVMLTRANAVGLVRGHDVVVDCTDNVETRYLLNDAAVLERVPLVSGAAVRCDGQITTYNRGPDGPCYRCIFPEPPARATVTNCSDGGVLGMVPGVVGCLQALEVTKLLVGSRLGPDSSRSLLVFDARGTTFRKVKLRPRRKVRVPMMHT